MIFEQIAIWLKCNVKDQLQLLKKLGKGKENISEKTMNQNMFINEPYLIFPRDRATFNGRQTISF